MNTNKESRYVGLAPHVRRVIDRAGVSADELAARTGLEPERVRDLVAGTGQPASVAEYDALCPALNALVDWV